jgi:hypothetical protein
MPVIDRRRRHEFHASAVTLSVAIRKPANREPDRLWAIEPAIGSTSARFWPRSLPFAADIFTNFAWRPTARHALRAIHSRTPNAPPTEKPGTCRLAFIC